MAGFTQASGGIAMARAGSAASALPRALPALGLADLGHALRAGWADFTACPRYGLFFGGVYVAAGLFLALALFGWGQPAWLVPGAAGFPLLAPFVAVGLYEVSRRREAGLPLGWHVVLGALKGRGDDQIMAMGVIVFVAFGFWLMLAHAIFAIFLGDAGKETLAMLLTPDGLMMLAVGSGVGGAMALGFYAITVISLPMLVDRDVDFLTAIITSITVVRANPLVMLGWAAIIALLLGLAMLPAFLGLVVALPVLGHATWHLYRRATTPG